MNKKELITHYQKKVDGVNLILSKIKNSYKNEQSCKALIKIYQTFINQLKEL